MMSSHYGTPQTEAHFLPDALHLEISNFLDNSRPARHDYNNGYDRLGSCPQAMFSTLPPFGLPSPPDSNSAPPSHTTYFPRLERQPRPLQSQHLLPHYLSFSTSIETNYPTWSTRMTMALTAAGLASHITHGLVEPPREAEFSAWLDQDEEVKRMIMSKLSDHAWEKMLQASLAAADQNAPQAR